MAFSGKRILLIAGASLGLLVVVAAGFTWSIRQFLDGDALRARLEREILFRTGMEGGVMAIEWQGSTLRTTGFEGRGKPGAALQFLRVEDVECDWSPLALLRGVWRIESIHIRSVEIRLVRGRWPAETSAPGHAPAATSNPERTSWTTAFLPRKLEWGTIHIDDGKVLWDDGASGRAAWTGVRMEASPAASGRWRARITAGSLQAPPFPTMDTRLALLEIHRDGIGITEWNFVGKERGTARVTGRIQWDNPPAPQAGLTYQFENLPAGEFLRGDWRATVVGGFHGNGTVDIAGARTRAAAEIELKDGRLRGLPFLQPLAVATSMQEWLDVPLDKAWARIRGGDGVWMAEKVVVESSTLARLEGSLTVDAGKLDGLFEVGVRERVVRLLPGSRSEIFTLDQAGYLWARPGMKLEGTVEDPREDLSPRLKTAAAEAVGRGVQGVIENVLDRANRLVPPVP